MNFTYDTAKDEQNRAKHGLSLALASELEWDGAIVWQDARHAYGEDRICGIGYIGNRLYQVVYVDRHEVRRIISLRKANKREEKRYAET